MDAMNGNGEYFAKIIPDGTTQSPGLEFKREQGSGLMREKDPDSAITVVKRGQKRLRITDDEVEVIGTFVADSFAPDKILLQDGSASDPALSFINHTNSGLYWSTSPSGLGVTGGGITQLTVGNDGVTRSRIKYSFTDNVSGMQHQDLGGGSANLILYSAQTGAQQPQLRCENDHVYVYNYLDVEDQIQTQAYYGWTGSESKIADEVKSGTTKRVRITVQTGTGASTSGLLIEPTHVYCGSESALTDFSCANLLADSSTMNALTTTSLNSSSITNSGQIAGGTLVITGGGTISGLTSTSITNSGTLSSGAITCSGSISCGTNSFLCGSISSTVQPYIRWEMSAATVQSIPTGTGTPVTAWNNVVLNRGFAAPGVNGVITIPTTGTYLAEGYGTWAGSVGSIREMWFSDNSGIFNAMHRLDTAAATSAVSQHIIKTFNLTAGASLSVLVAHFQAGNLNFGTNGSAIAFFNVYRLG